MRLDRIVLREIHLPLKHFFETSFGRVYERHVVLVEINSDGLTGWGECVAAEGPYYSYETVSTAWSILSELILPRLVDQSIQHPDEFGVMFRAIRGHHMARAAVESSLWDLWSRFQGLSLWKALGGELQQIACGVSIGIQDHPDLLLEKIDQEVKAGYRKIKIKIKPGWDLEIVKLVRRNYPEIPLMVDANSAYSLKDRDLFAALDDFGLLMIEQPLRYDDLLDHSKLQALIKTPLCLDESIRHLDDARHAIELGSCRIINIKMGRVGGHSEARRIHDLCRSRNVPVWCGGMLETGIGRAHNIAVSTLPGFVIPGDVSASQRYYHRDTIHPPIEVSRDGFICAPLQSGLGYDPDSEWIEQITLRRQVFC
ncbi:MAG: o-succinylbenzoate synthase [Acidobacteria bacterium]|nr:o-succinylbenzoate synthase [Acidobacteriota bacterium]